MQKLRVIQWGTGNVGRHALRAVLDDPRLELVGLHAHSADKQGQDAGALCGRPDTGVIATGDVAALAALKADAVVYTPFVGDLEHIVRMLESGADVISTNLLINVGGVHGDTRAQLEAACRRGGSSFIVSGVNPGWVNSVTTALTAVCRKVNMVSIYESADCTGYESPETWSTLGMGEPEVSAETQEAAKAWFVMFRDTVLGVAEALGIELERTELTLEFAKAAERVDLGWFLIEEGATGAVRARWSGYAGERERVRSQITWYLTPRLKEGWELQHEDYNLVVDGEPNVRATIDFPKHANWENGDSSITTALPVVSALHALKAAPAGVLGLRDLGLPHAPVGVWDAR